MKLARQDQVGILFVDTKRNNAINDDWVLYQPIAPPKVQHKNQIHMWGLWQEWRDSNPQPPVLETGALAN